MSEENKYTFENKEYRDTYRHTVSHILAQAVKRLYPEVKLAIGPSIDNGFYYDFDAPFSFTQEHLDALEAEMRKICKEKEKLERFELPREEAIKFMEEREEPYKVELINDLPEDATISFYKQGEFTDLCAGPHLDSTGRVKGNGIKLMNVTGAYWRGDSSKKMLQRIYGTAFPKKDELDQYLNMLEEAKKRDHRKLGKELGLFMLTEEGPGFPFFLPNGMILKNTLIDYWREVHKRYGYVEVSTPMILNRKLWERSGHWDHYKQNMYTTVIDDEDYAIKPMNCPGGMLVYKAQPHSYKELPLSLYQIQVKFRDEIRPRFGLLRSREFIMKDAYSFHADQESLQKTYDEMSEAYGRICDRMGMDYRPVEADPGQIGGSVTCEFMALAEAGEAELVHCTCGYAANTEAGDCLARPTVYDVPMEKVATPGVHTIAELAAFLDIPESSTVKALSGKNDEGKLVVMFIPGDHELNELKAARVAGGFTLLTDEDMEAFGLHKGSMGPVGLPEEAYVIAARSLQAVPKWVVGANEDGYHYVGARLGEDFQVDEWADLCIVQPGDSCPSCGLPLEGARGIEVSQVFQLGDKYSKAMGATFMAEDGSEQPFLMGCYGVGISRTMAAIVEQHNDENGIMWPLTVAPAHVCVIPLTVGDDEVQPAAEKLASDLAKLGLEVVIDDRKERAGVKFADADLIGWPLQVIVGKRGLAEQKVEIKRRSTGARRDIPLAALTDALAFSQRNAKVWGSELSLFGGLFE